MFRKLSLGLAFSLACSAVFAADAPAPAKPAAALPAETFFSYAKVSAAKVSPDGKYLAMAVANEKTGLEKNILAIISIDDMKVQASFGLLGDQSVADFWWANDERVLVSSQIKTGSLESPLLDGKLYAINIDGSKYKILLGDNSQQQQQNNFTHTHHQETTRYFDDMLLIPEAKDNSHVLFQAYSGLHQADEAYDLDIYTGSTRLVATSPTFDGSVDSDFSGAVRIAEGSNQANGEAKFFYRADGENAPWQDLSGLVAHDEDTAVSGTGPIEFTGDGKGIYWHYRSPTTTRAVGILDPVTQKISPLFSDPVVDADSFIWSFRYSANEHIIGVVTYPGLPKVDFVDADDIKAQYLQQLYQAFPGQMVYITSNTRDHTRMVVYVYSDKNPGDFYLFDTKTAKVAFLFSEKPEIDPEQMAAMQPITITARDGLVLHGYLTVPPGSSGKNLPLIINPHGGPHGIRDYWQFNPEAQFFASRGYAFLQVNYRGSGGYGAHFQDIGYRHWASTMQDDLADSVQWAEKQGIADPNRVCIYGASYGGYAAMENAERYPDLYKCVVGYVGLYDLNLFDKHYAVENFASGRRAGYAYLGDDEKQLAADSPVNNADKLKAPVFIIYGGQDKLVVPANATEMLSALDKAGKPHEPPLYRADEAHGFRGVENNVELYTKMLAFFDQYIGSNAAKTGASAATGATGTKP